MLWTYTKNINPKRVDSTTLAVEARSQPVGQATRLSRWLGTVTRDYADVILPFDEEIAQIWGKLRVPHAENPLDKQIAATALMYGLTVVTRNLPHYALPA